MALAWPVPGQRAIVGVFPGVNLLSVAAMLLAGCVTMSRQERFQQEWERALVARTAEVRVALPEDKRSQEDADRLQRDAHRAAWDVLPGGLEGLFRRYRFGIGRRTVLEQMGGRFDTLGRMQSCKEWTADDLVVARRVGIESQLAADSWLHTPGAYLEAEAAFCELGRSDFLAYIQDSSLEPYAAGRVFAAHRGWDRREFLPMSGDELAHFYLWVDRLSRYDGVADEVCRRVAEEAHQRYTVTALWQDGIPDRAAAAMLSGLVATMQTSGWGGAAGRSSPFQDSEGVDLWLARALAADSSTRFHEAGLRAMDRRCWVMPEPTLFSCPRDP